MSQATTAANTRTPLRRKPKLSLLEQAAELVRKEYDNLSHSAPRAVLGRLDAIARELDAIEAHL